MSEKLDFVQTMKDWRRMCKQMDEKFGMDGCEHCPLVCCSAIYESDGREDYAEIARKVAGWAKAHPEPVYPTWYEWLTSIGAVTRKVKPDVASTLIETGLLDHIPANTAQKLGIEPKNG